MPESPAIRVMSMSDAGCASRNFISGMRLCPPARTLASPPELARRWIACAAAVANLLRVGAEIAMGAPSGGFTGLPFVFSEFNRPSDQYREQASLAIALLAVGLPAWFIHFQVAQRAALRSVEERASALRSLYL